jgi:activator of Hsp90 ATPase-like protein
LTSSNTKPAPAKQPDEFEFLIMRNFNAPRDRVWRAWTEEASLGKWWGPKDFDIVSAKLDLRPGGTFRYMLRSPDGQDMWGKLIFREIVPQERLVFEPRLAAHHTLDRHPRRCRNPQDHGHRQMGGLRGDREGARGVRGRRGLDAPGLDRNLRSARPPPGQGLVAQRGAYHARKSLPDVRRRLRGGFQGL